MVPNKYLARDLQVSAFFPNCPGLGSGIDAHCRMGNFAPLLKLDLFWPVVAENILDESRRLVNEAHRARFLLEIDMGTHDNISFSQEKALPGVAYIKSPVFKERFGSNDAHWLIVTAGGERRMKKMMSRTEKIIGSDSYLFFFTMLDCINADNLLTSPVWWQFGKDSPKPLLPK